MDPQPKVDYEYAANSSARRSCLNKLDPVYIVGVRYVTRPFRTSSLPSLYCESGMTPLHLRRQLMLLRCMGKILAAELFKTRFGCETQTSVHTIVIARLLDQPVSVHSNNPAFQLQAPTVQAHVPFGSTALAVS